MADTRTCKREVRAEIRRVAELGRDPIDRGVKSAEEVGEPIAAQPLEGIERLDGSERTATSAREGIPRKPATRPAHASS